MRKRQMIKVFIAYIISTLGLTYFNFGAVVSDNDGSGYVSKAEFNSAKNSIEKDIVGIYEQMQVLLKDELQTTLSNLNVGDITTELDKIYPIGSITIGETPPGYGEWSEIIADGRCLWNEAGKSFGVILNQQMPEPIFVVATASDIHSVQIDGYTSEETVRHSHNITTSVGYVKRDTMAKNGTGASIYNTKTKPSGLDHKPHSHKYKIAGSMTAVSAHTHDIVWSDDNPYKGAPGSKVQPNAYVVKMWKRTA